MAVLSPLRMQPLRMQPPQATLPPPPTGSMMLRLIQMLLKLEESESHQPKAAWATCRVSPYVRGHIKLESSDARIFDATCAAAGLATQMSECAIHANSYMKSVQ